MKKMMKSDWITKIIIVAAALIGLWLLYGLFEDNTAKYEKYQHTIDSLSHEVVKLDSMHVKQDSIIVVYKDSIVYMDNIIIEEKTKFVKIKNKYNEIRSHVDNYSSSQLDSFFTNRYSRFF
jgi:predicted membrane-bound spermidine synthase